MGKNPEFEVFAGALPNGLNSYFESIMEVGTEPTPTQAITATEPEIVTETETPEQTLTETVEPTGTMEASEMPEMALTPELTHEGKQAGCDFSGWKQPDGDRHVCFRKGLGSDQQRD